MTAEHKHGRSGMPPRRMARRRLLPVLAAVSAWAVCLVGAAPTAQATDARSQQWYLDAMQAEEMWKVSTGKGIKVAVVDTGVNPHTDSLRGQVLPGKNMTGTPGTANDDYDGHGTTMAEYIVGTGKNGGIQGLAPGAKVIPIRAPLDGLKDWEKATSSSKAVRAAADSDAQIINLSFGDPNPASDLQEAVEYAIAKGKLVFASVGNDGDKDNLPNYPASFPGVVGVAAGKRSGKVAEFSQHGDSPDLTAPGVALPQWCDNSFEEYCPNGGGTSSAAAIASASAALIWSMHPEWTANQVLRVLVETAGRKEESDAPSRYIGYGMVRPRLHLLEGKGDPGDPDKNPIENVEPIVSPSGSPSSEDSGSPTRKIDAKNSGEDAESQTEKASSEAENDSDLWIYLGAGAAIAVVAVGALVLVRRALRA